MEIEYELSVADMAAFLRFHLRHRPKRQQHPLGRVVSTVLSVVLVVMAGLSGWFYLQPKGSWLSGFCAGVVIGFLSIAVIFGWLQAKTLIPNAIRLYWDREECRWYFARKRLRIAALGLQVTNEFQQVRYSWSVVWLIDSTNEHLFFFVTRGQALIIPRRAFRDDQHFEDFINLACCYHKGLPPKVSGSDIILDALPAEQTGITLPRQP